MEQTSSPPPPPPSFSSPFFPCPTPITGVKTPGGKPSPRLPLDVFKSTKPLAFSLYVQALATWQANGNEIHDKDNKNGISYFQVTGIHGAPYVTWQEDPTKPAENDPKVGYCTHRSVLFIPWHRPYLMLFEQMIYAYAEDIVVQATGNVKTEYAKALPQVRLPYWDWANNPALPEAVTQPDIDLVVPSDTPGKCGKLHLEHNPLYSYKFASKYANDVNLGVMGWKHTKEWQESKRCPNAKGESDQEKANENMQKLSKYKRLTFQHLLRCKDFDEFTTMAWRPELPVQSYTSVELMHNNVHDYVGTNNCVEPVIPGNMSKIQASAFDPIFWLHHVNCDRITALWQAINTGIVIRQFPSQNPRYVAKAGALEDGSSKLEPWHKTADRSMDNYWVADDVKDLISTFDNGYYYPENPLEYLQDPAKMKKHTIEQIYKLYGPRKAESAPTFGAPAREPPASISPEEPEEEAPDSGLLLNYTTETWQAFLRVKNFALAGTWAVHIFLGQVPENSTDWFLSESRIGSVTMLSTTDLENCANCLIDAANEQLVTGTVPLEDALQKRGIDISDQDAVVAYLKENLHWRVAQNAQNVPITQNMNLTVGVSSQSLTLPESFDELPTYGPVRVYREVTSGKLGGLSEENRSDLGPQTAVEWL